MPGIIRFTHSLNTLSKQVARNELINTNLQSERYGLRLTEADATQIISAREHALSNLGRVEIGMEVTSKLLNTFCRSPYISQPEYTAIICELIEIFYYLKNETLDKISDDELLGIMKEYFDDRCFGSMELLLNRELENLIEQVRDGSYKKVSIENEV